MSSVPPIVNVSDDTDEHTEGALMGDTIKATELMLKGLSERFHFSLLDPNFKGTPLRVSRAWDEILIGYTQDPAEILRKCFPNDGYNQMIVVKDIKFFSMCAHHMLPFYGNIAVGYIPSDLKGRKPVAEEGSSQFKEMHDYAVQLEAAKCRKTGAFTCHNEETGGDQWLWDNWSDDLEAAGYKMTLGEGGQVVGLSKIARVCHAFARRFQLQERLTQQIADAIEKHLVPKGVAVFIYDSIHLCMHMRGVQESHSTMDTNVLRGEFMTDPAVRDEFFRMVGR